MKWDSRHHRCRFSALNIETTEEEKNKRIPTERMRSHTQNRNFTQLHADVIVSSVCFKSARTACRYYYIFFFFSFFLSVLFFCFCYLFCFSLCRSVSVLRFGNGICRWSIVLCVRCCFFGPLRFDNLCFMWNWICLSIPAIGAGYGKLGLGNDGAK